MLWASTLVLVAATASWAVVGWSRFGAGVVLAVVAPVVTVGAALVLGWSLMRRGVTPSPSRPAPEEPARMQCALPAPSAAPSLSTEQLCWAWRRSFVHLGRCASADELARLADLRRGYLDELQRRDPAVFARWLPTARAAGDPARSFCRPGPQHGLSHPSARTGRGLRSPSAG